MARVLAAVVFLATLAPAGDGVAQAVLEHDLHPGLAHPESGEGDHRHGDPDDHHESPESPCHHHDEHTCCHPAPVLGLPATLIGIESATGGPLHAVCLAPRVLPTARKLLHVPLA